MRRGSHKGKTPKAKEHLGNNLFRHFWTV